MFNLDAYLFALAALLGFAVFFWLVSILKRDVSIVDSLWPLMFLLATAIYLLMLPESGPRTSLILVLVSIWALRLFTHITVRNWGEPEDYRYQQIRANNQPGFAFKSLYLVFGLQAILAWIISIPLLLALNSPAPLGWLDTAGIVLWLVGMFFESVGDYQLMRFKSKRSNRGKVLDTGLWRYTRHPNYFGEACIWWGYFAIAMSAGGWWSIIAPLLMTFLLLRVSGVAMLERDIQERRPAYRWYIEHTNAFIPGPRKLGFFRKDVKS